LLCAQSAAQPETCGVAILVPLIVLCNPGRGHEENVLTPGPAISILPPQEKDAMRKVLSTAATAITVGEFAGDPVGAIRPGRLLAFPAAAIIRHPAARAAAPAAVYEGCGGALAPRDMEITEHLLAIAQFIPARTCIWVPPPEFVKTLPTCISAWNPIP
jgi:hypothetical protein